MRANLTPRWPAAILIILAFSAFRANGQTLITVGTGTVQNGFTTFPAPYGNANNGARHQMLILASELQASGMAAGEISSVAFDVAAQAFIFFEGFTVALGTTSATEMTAAWLPGMTTVHGPLGHADLAGWNTHPFDAPFYWDGTSNLVVQTCFYNQEVNFNSIFNQTATPFNSTLSRSTPNSNVCSAQMGTLITHPQRPNMRFEWTSLEAPPVAAFTQSATFTCDGAVQFTDNSSFFPTAWEWTFGDGGTSAEQNPAYTYLTAGTYTPQLIVSNAFGIDTVQGTPIVVGLGAPVPIAACIPTSTGTVDGFGILSATIGGFTSNSTSSVVEGYLDQTCLSWSAPAGTLLDLALATGTAAAHNVRCWIDWDNDGELVEDELVLTADIVTSANVTITIPASAVLDTPLRVRFVADYSVSPYPTPCADPQFGQAEDYTLFVTPNDSPAEADFTFVPAFSCDGLVQFTDASVNAPTSWTWSFGDDTGSNDPSPSHTYTQSGTYTVQLIVNNANGGDTLTLVDAVTVDLSAQLLPASCTPETVGNCCQFGITSVVFAGINTTSPDGSEGYQDRSCGNVALITEGDAYPISIGTGGAVDHDVRIWIDFNNDGAFGANEAVWYVTDAQDPTANVTIPSGSVYGTLLRMRIMADVVGETTGPCEQPLYGQVEDYSVILSPNPDPPTAAFSATPRRTCTGVVNFTDASSNAPQSWLWNFGDTNTSTEQSPTHTYTSAGIYTVSLTATNANGSDTQTSNNYITVVEAWACDTLEVSNFQDEEYTTCQGVLSDDGGPNANYSPGTSEEVTIAPAGAEVVHIVFSQFQWGNNPNRHLVIYDGPDVNSPLIGEFNGNGLAQLLNNGSITSSGNSITLRQEAQGGGGGGTGAGFLLTWECFFTSIDEPGSDPIGAVWPVPASDELNISFSAQKVPTGRIVLRSALGALVHEEKVAPTNGMHRMATAGMEPGVYTLSLETPTGRWNRTVVLN